jgi:1,2-diacylglycerol 3-alpha-glucosyltransferase
VKNRLNILMTIENYPVHGGSGVATRRLAESLVKEGHNIAVICPGENKENGIGLYTESGVAVYRLRSMQSPPFIYKGRVSLFPTNHLKCIFKEFKPDIVHIIDHFFISGAAISLARKNKIKIIGTNHFNPGNWLYNTREAIGRLSINSYFSKAMVKLLWFDFLKTFSRIDVVTTPTLTAAKIIRDAGFKKPVHVISNGIDLREYSGKPDDDILDKFKIKKNRIILLSASRLDKEKRVDLLIEAVSIIKHSIDFQLIITSIGQEREKLENLVLKNQLSDKVIFTGFVNNSDLKKLYKISDIFLTASEVELQGLSIMEAMASELPIIAANSMAIPELVKNGINGFLFEPNDAIELSRKILLLATDKKLKRKMSQNSLDIIKEHDIEKP